MPSGLALLRVFDTVYLATLGIWAGATLFCGFGARAVVEASVDSASRGEIEHALRARALLWGAVCGSIALPALVCGAMAVPEMRGPIVGLQAVALLAALLMTLARAGSSKSTGARGRGWLAEGVIVAVLLGLLVAHTHRVPPTTRGIEELSPVERSRAIKDALRRRANGVDPRESPPEEVEGSEGRDGR